MLVQIGCPDGPGAAHDMQGSGHVAEEMFAARGNKRCDCARQVPALRFAESAKWNSKCTGCARSGHSVQLQPPARFSPARSSPACLFKGCEGVRDPPSQGKFRRARQGSVFNIQDLIRWWSFHNVELNAKLYVLFCLQGLKGLQYVIRVR